MLWDPSVLDSEEGIRFWGRSIPECQEVLPTAPGGTEMLPEAMFWYLLTGRVPSEAESKQFQEELVKNLAIFQEECQKFVEDYYKHGPMEEGLTPKQASDRLQMFQNHFEALWKKHSATIATLMQL